MTDLDQNLDVRRFFAFGGRGCRKARFLGSAALLTLLFGCGKAPAEADAAQTPQEVACGLTNSKADAYTKLFLSFIFDKTHTRYLPMNGVGLSEVPPKIMPDYDRRIYDHRQEFVQRRSNTPARRAQISNTSGLFTWKNVAGIYVRPWGSGGGIIFEDELSPSPKFNLTIVGARLKSVLPGPSDLPKEAILFMGIDDSRRLDLPNFVSDVLRADSGRISGAEVATETYGEGLCALSVARQNGVPVKVVAAFDAQIAKDRALVGEGAPKRKIMTACMLRARFITFGLPLLGTAKIYNEIGKNSGATSWSTSWDLEWRVMLGAFNALPGHDGETFPEVCPAIRDRMRKSFEHHGLDVRAAGEKIKSEDGNE